MLLHPESVLHSSPHGCHLYSSRGDTMWSTPFLLSLLQKPAPLHRESCIPPHPSSLALIKLHPAAPIPEEGVYSAALALVTPVTGIRGLLLPEGSSTWKCSGLFTWGYSKLQCTHRSPGELVTMHSSSQIGMGLSILISISSPGMPSYWYWMNLQRLELTQRDHFRMHIVRLPICVWR